MRTELTGPARFSDETVHGNANGVLSASPGLARGCAGLIVLAACVLPDRASGASSVQFSRAMFLADENRSPAQVAVQRAGDLTSPLTVSVTTTNGTALAGEDYLAVSAPVTFAPGETNKVVEIPLLDDYFAETDKTVVLRFKDLPGGVTSTRLQSTLLILDDDRPGSIDLSWRSTLGMPEQKPNDYFYAPSMVQPDGMIIVTVYYATADYQIQSRRVIRLNTDGSMDSTFPPLVTSPYWTALMPDGKIILAEAVPNSSVTTAKLKRYNSDGTPDETFTSSVEGTPQIVGLSNGKMLLLGCSTYYGGRLNRVNGTAVKDLVRLNNDGSLDSTFSAPGTITFIDFGGSDRRPLVVFPNGKILVGTSTSRLVYLLEEDGSPDPSFAVGSATLSPDFGSPPFVIGLLVQTDGKILVGGMFDQFNGSVRNGIMRLNADGTLDGSFRTGLGFGEGGAATALDLLPNGQVLVNGVGSLFDGVATTAPFVLNADGSPDRSFERPPISEYAYYTITEGQIIFPTEWGLALARLRTDFPLRIVSTTRDGNGTARLTANALTSRSYTLQSSENLTNWSDLTTKSATINRLDFTDAPTNSSTKRFYRVKQD